MFSNGAIVTWKKNHRATGVVHGSDHVVTDMEVFGDGFCMTYWTSELVLSLTKVV